jgi:hypothetical protein
MEFRLAGDRIGFDLDGGWVMEDDKKRMSFHKVRSFSVNHCVA